MSLTFDQLSRAHHARQEDSFRHTRSLTLGDWACALAGEVGEACNYIKDLRREQTVRSVGASEMKLYREMIAKELANVVSYTELLAMQLGIDLGKAVTEKFNEVSDCIDSEVKL